MGTYDTQGNRLSETIYHPGTPTPIARIDQNGEVIHLHSDHLGTPRLATDTSQTVVWRWVSDAFGTTEPEQDPDGDGVSTKIDHRFAGQYYDEETGLHYNWRRYYDPGTGRYVTSDPIGLDGGLNTYGYAYQSPLTNTDPTGLVVQACAVPPITAGCVAVTQVVVNTVVNTVGVIAITAWSWTWDDDDYIPDDRYGGYTSTDEDDAIELSKNLTGKESCELLDEAITALENRKRGRQENIDEDFYGMGDDGHIERIQIINVALERLQAAKDAGNCC